MKFIAAKILLEKFNLFPGLCMFLMQFLEKLISIDNISSFYTQIVIDNNNTLPLLCEKAFFTCDDEAIHSLYIFIFQSELVNFTCLRANWIFWVIADNSLMRFPKKWCEEFRSLLSLPVFRKVYKKLHKLRKPLYNTIVDTAMWRTRTISMPDTMYGFITKNVFMFIQDFHETDLKLNKEGTFSQLFTNFPII